MSGEINSSMTVLSRAIARRTSRRSFLGRVGRTAVVLSLGSAGVMLREEPAWASCGDCIGNCCGSDSIFCFNLPGGQNACPSGTCECGSWTEADSHCPAGFKRFTDCCGNCASGKDCACINGTPTCCRHKTHSGGCDGCSSFIKCRIVACI